MLQSKFKEEKELGEEDLKTLGCQGLPLSAGKILFILNCWDSQCTLLIYAECRMAEREKQMSLAPSLLIKCLCGDLCLLRGLGLCSSVQSGAGFPGTTLIKQDSSWETVAAPQH